MTQEDGFIEVRTYLENKRTILKWIRPVVIKRIRLLFDVYSTIIVARESGLDFTDLENLDTDELMIWMIYGAMQSYASLKNHRLSITAEDVRPIVDGMMTDAKRDIVETYTQSREVGSLIESYQRAKKALSGDQEEEGQKKDEGQVSGQMN